MSRPRSRAGQLDLAALVLRGILGSTMIAHGVRHGKTLKGTAGWFGSIGFDEPELQARLSAVTEIGSGAALLLGAATPAANAAVIGTMATAARTVHVENGYFIVKEGYEYVLALAGAATALNIIGPGQWSVDRAVGLDRRFSGIRAALGSLALGVGTSAALLAKYWTKPAPKSS